MKYTLFFFLIFFSALVLGHNDKDQKGYAILADKKLLSSLLEDDIFLRFKGDTLESLEELICMIRSLADTGDGNTKFCIINSACYRENMTKVNNKNITASFSHIKCISGTWMSLPAWIILLHELTLLELQKKGKVTGCNPFLYTRFLKDTSGRVIYANVESLQKTIDRLGKNAELFCYNRQRLAFYFARSLESQNKYGELGGFLSKSPFENEAYNYYFDKLRCPPCKYNAYDDGVYECAVPDLIRGDDSVIENGTCNVGSQYSTEESSAYDDSSETKEAGFNTGIDSNENVSESYVPSVSDSTIKRDSYHSGSESYQYICKESVFSGGDESGNNRGDCEDCEDYSDGGDSNDDETFLKQRYEDTFSENIDSSYCEENDFLKFAELIQELSVFTKNTDPKSKHPRYADYSSSYDWLDENIKSHREKKTLDLSHSLSMEEPDFFDTVSYDEGVFFLFGEFSASYHQDVMIDHMDIGMLFDTASNWFYHILKKKYRFMYFFMNRCVHYDVVKTSLFHHRNSLNSLEYLAEICDKYYDISGMLSDLSHLPLNKMTANANAYLYRILDTALHQPNVFKGAIFCNSFSNIMHRFRSLGLHGAINGKNMHAFKQRTKTYQLSLLLLQQTIERKIKKKEYQFLSSGAFYDDGDIIKDFRPKTIYDFSVLWDKSVTTGIEVVEPIEEQEDTSILNIMLQRIKAKEDVVSGFRNRNYSWESDCNAIRKDLYVWRYCKHAKLLNLDRIHCGSMICTNFSRKLFFLSDRETYNMTNFNYLHNIQFYRKKRYYYQGWR
ncbi:MAG: hypothetical protein QS721_06515 [Candidatus Endonucleobacter sp. (ex Gigantidas childressi)]|nr:hypothetical protein [Candidatus Endonucleobacter sp. (ex Gigantidas childressi)]